MAKCGACGGEIPESGRFCSACGAVVSSDAFLTQTVAVSTPSTAHGAAGTSSAHSSSTRTSRDGRFAPGALLAGRYRIVALLGKGGMGEVYRADDLTLDQPVALKFLPEAVASSPEAVERFRNEVRIARQVSHANVCRVYDLGEIGGQYFLSMEYVDGEDLGSLLRRIGRLPTDKANEIARKLCAGLAAAHEKGVLHRDLKPSNVMLDSRGQVLLTDFGLAGLAGQIEGAEVRNGTPAYMAPEQLAGEEVSVRSDIYSLGLVLYEIFTGKLPFESDTLAGLIKARTNSAPAGPSTLVKHLDPMIERVILRCLQVKPANRPASALAVAAALPGGNPLAEALAAGETPSPEMVAAAGEGEGLKPWVAATLLASIAIAAVVGAATGIHFSALEKMQLEYSPEVLAQKAREVVQKVGGSAHPADSVYGLRWEEDFINQVKKDDKPRPDWPAVLAQRPNLLRFWYRQSLTPLTAETFHDDLLTPGVVGLDDPPPTEAAMVRVDLDSQGRLLYYERMPAQLQKPLTDPPKPVDWSALFSAAGLDTAQLQPTEARWTFLAASDTRAAWTGTWPGSNRSLRVEAAAMRGRPVVFSLIGGWPSEDRAAEDPKTAGQQIAVLILAALALVFLGGAALLARRNLRDNRGDRRGALRLAVFVFWVQMALWLCRGHFTASIGTFGIFLLAVCTSVFAAVVVWGVYIAIEPYVRRRWPQTLIGWSAVLTGRFRDAVVGRDVLIGVLAGVGFAAMAGVVNLVFHHSGDAPIRVTPEALLGLRSALGIGVALLPGAVRNALLFLFLLFLLRAVFRNQWVAAAVFGLIFAAVGFFGGDQAWVTAIEAFLAFALTAFLLLRWGLLALIGEYFANNVFNAIPFTSHTSAWYFGYSIFMLAAILGLAVWGFRTATAGRRLWRANLLD
jgi:predicted Ser/Thr protein kinase